MCAIESQQCPVSEGVRRVRAVILDIVGDDTVLLGTLPGLARGLGTTVPVLLLCLRELLMAGRITVEADTNGRLVIRDPSPLT